MTSKDTLGRLEGFTPGEMTVRDRSDSVIKTFVEEGVSVADFGIALDVTRPPFALGGVAALVATSDPDGKANAYRLAHCWNVHDEREAELSRLRAENAELREACEFTLRTIAAGREKTLGPLEMVIDRTRAERMIEAALARAPEPTT